MQDDLEELSDEFSMLKALDCHGYIDIFRCNTAKNQHVNNDQTKLGTNQHNLSQKTTAYRCAGLPGLHGH